MRTGARVIGWILIGLFIFQVAGMALRASFPDTFEIGPSEEGAIDELARNYRSRPVSTQLALPLLAGAIGVGLVMVGRRKPPPP